MRLLKISFVLACFLLFSMGLNAQRPGGGPGHLPNLDSMRVKLNLSADQEKQIKTIVDNYRPKLKEARDSTQDQAARREALAPLLQAMNTDIKAVLNDEQKQKLAEMRANRSKRGKKPGNG